MDDTQSESEQVTIRKYTPQTKLEKLLDKQLRYIFNEAVKYRELSEKQDKELVALRTELAQVKEDLVSESRWAKQYKKEVEELRELVRDIIFYLDNYNNCLPNADVREILNRPEVKAIMEAKP